MGRATVAWVLLLGACVVLPARTEPPRPIRSAAAGVGLSRALATAASALAHTLVPALQDRRRNVAVLPVSCGEARCDLGELLAGEVERQLAARGVALVERAHLRTVRAEQRLSRRGLVDDTTSAEAGNLRGARVHVLGRMVEASGRYAVQLRAVDTQTAQLLVIAAVDLVKTEECEALFTPAVHEPEPEPRVEPQRRVVTLGEAATSAAESEPPPPAARRGRVPAYDDRDASAAGRPAPAASAGRCTLGGLGGTYSVVTHDARTGELFESTWELVRDDGRQLHGQSTWPCCPGRRVDALRAQVSGGHLTVTRDCSGQGAGDVACVEAYTGAARRGVVEGSFTRNGTHAGRWHFTLCGHPRP